MDPPSSKDRHAEAPEDEGTLHRGAGWAWSLALIHTVTRAVGEAWAVLVSHLRIGRKLKTGDCGSE